MNALDVAYLALAGLSAPWWLRKSRGGWRERRGFIEPLPEAARPRVMLHSVSVGETAAIGALVERLAREADVLVTASTDTGLAEARKRHAGHAHVRRYPLDFSACVERFLDAARPSVAAIVETERWPNFAGACRRRGIPVGFINGRMSDKTFARMMRLRGLARRQLAMYDFIAVQDERAAERFERLGVPPNRCLVTGSMKFDTNPPLPEGADPVHAVPGAAALRAELGLDPNRPLVVAGSTAEDEHLLLDQAVPPGVQLLVAPRDATTWDAVATQMPRAHRRTARTPAPPGTDRYILDTIGELKSAYALADVVVIGRSFGTLAGSNPLESVCLGKATIIGPRVSAFRDIVESLDRAGALARADRGTLAATLRTLLQSPERRAALGHAGKACIPKYMGASERHAELLLSMVG